MSLPTHASLTLSRFDSLQSMSQLGPIETDRARFLGTAADVRACYTGPGCDTAFTFITYGIHDSEESAKQTIDDRHAISPWLADASESWSAVLRPFRHYGETNFLDRQNPGEIYQIDSTEHEADAPLVVLTTAGWNFTEDLDMAIVREFGAGVSSVRISMSGTPGLHSQQTFSFLADQQLDGITVTFWQNFAAMRDFAYVSGLHKQWMKRQREETLADRTSFTRFAVLHSEGTWRGKNPLEF